MNTIPFIDLEGTPLQMGRQHGEMLRGIIGDLADERLTIICEAISGISISDVECVARGILETTKTMLPDIYEESRATAEASGLDHWRLLVAGGLSDVIDVCAKRYGAPQSCHECTLWPASGVDGEALLIGTWDSHASAQNALVVVRRRPLAGVSSIALSTAGWPMQQGVTAVGLAFAIANLVGKRQANGTSYICALPSITKFNLANEAAVYASQIPLCSARYFAFVDAKGNFQALESDGVESWFAPNSCGHTNHFFFPGSAPAEGRAEGVGNSQARLRAAEERLGNRGDEINLLKGLSRTPIGDHAIVQSGVGRADRTCAAFVLNPAKQRITFSAGPPEQSPVFSVSLTEARVSTVERMT